MRLRRPTIDRHAHRDAEDLRDLINQLDECVAWLKSNYVAFARLDPGAGGSTSHLLALRHVAASTQFLEDAVKCLHTLSPQEVRSEYPHA
jgi:hypothetical protein